MTRCSITGDADLDAAGNDVVELSLPNQKFRVIDDNTKQGFVILQILDYTPSPAVNPNFLRYNFKGDTLGYKSTFSLQPGARDYGSHQVYFKVTVDKLDAYAVNNARIGWALSAGVINFPFKYRIQKKSVDFSGAFNFGAAVGVKIPRPAWQKFSYTILTGYSISNINLDSASINKTANLDKLRSTNNFSAFSFSIGVLVEYEKVQAGIFMGWDRISRLNDVTFDWKYQGKPWISVGFGYAIFSTEKAKAPASAGKDTNE